MKEFIDWLQGPENSSFVQMMSALVQAGAAIFSLYVAYLAIRVAKLSINTTAHTLVELIDFKLTGDPKFTLYNTGPGIAFNVQLYTVTLDSLEPDPLDPRLLWSDDSRKRADGPRYMQPNSKEDFKTDESWTRLLLGQPFLIRYQLSSGKKYSVYMLYRASSKITPLSRTEIVRYKLRVLWAGLRTPYMRSKKRLRKWKSDRIANVDRNENETKDVAIGNFSEIKHQLRHMRDDFKD
ncbi:MAG: hypothetical protein ACQEXQ_07645 [Bacillota bacterium]